ILNFEHDRRRLDDPSRFVEALTTIMGNGKHHVIPIVPYHVERSVRGYYAVEALKRAVVVARQPAMRVDLDWLRPRLAAIGGTREQDLRVLQRPACPPDVQVSRIFALRSIRDNVRLVFPWRILLGAVVRDDGNIVRFPGLAAIKRSAHVKSVAGGVVSPIVVGAELVESHVGDDGVTARIKHDRYVSGNSVAR